MNAVSYMLKHSSQAMNGFPRFLRFSPSVHAAMSVKLKLKNNDFGFQVIVKIMVEYASMCVKSHALLGRVSNATTPQEQAELKRISSAAPVAAALLPVRSVGVQGDGRSYSYAVALSSDRYPPDWQDMHYLAKIIPRVCHNVNRYLPVV